MSLDISNEAILVLASLLEAKTGQQIAPNRYWRIETVLKSVMAKYDIPDLDSLVAVVLTGDEEIIVNETVEAMLNNESSFFRDQALFNLITGPVLDSVRLRNANSRTINIWSAGCSTGQEVYSLAIAIADRPHKWSGWKIKIDGTDISSSAIKRAKAGLYTQFEIQRGLPVTQMMRYFSKRDDDWLVNQDVRDLVDFRVDNLLKPRIRSREYDIVLCRNVLMYFSPSTRQEAFSAISRALKPDGSLMLGAVETVIGQTDEFTASQRFRGLYVPNDTPDPIEHKPNLRSA